MVVSANAWRIGGGLTVSGCCLLATRETMSELAWTGIHFMIENVTVDAALDTIALVGVPAGLLIAFWPQARKWLFRPRQSAMEQRLTQEVEHVKIGIMAETGGIRQHLQVLDRRLGEIERKLP